MINLFISALSLSKPLLSISKFQQFCPSHIAPVKGTYVANNYHTCTVEVVEWNSAEYFQEKSNWCLNEQVCPVRNEVKEIY